MSTLTEPRTRKKPRRGHGEGSIYHRISDGKWVGTVDLGIVDGKRRRQVVYGKTRAEVVGKLDELRVPRPLGSFPTTSQRGGETLGPVLDRWLASLKPRPIGRHSLTTLKGYADIVRLHLKPILGHVRMAELSADHVELLQDRLLARGLSSQTVLNVRNTLSGSLRFAMRRRLLQYNPVDLVDAPSASRGVGRAIEHDETPRFLAAIRGHRLEAAFLMELALGCRRSEILGLEWDALDLRAGQERIHIRQGLHRVKGHGLVTLQPKSERGNRTLALPQQLAALLRRRQDEQIWEQVRAGNRWANTRPDGTERLVFTTLRGTPLEPGHFTNAVKAVLRSAGLGHLRGHDLRHSASSILQALGLPPLAAMEVLGHASPDVTMGIYGHLLSASRRQAAELMDGYLAEADAANS